MTLVELALIAFGFLCGSVPFAVLIARYCLDTDIRQHGDGNPGAFNVLRAGGLSWGALAVFLDIGKGALPVGLAAYIFDIDGLPLVLIAISPPLGHAFSPFLHFKGGKAIAATGGMLIGLSLWELPLVATVMLVFWYTALESNGWAVMLTAASVICYMLLTTAPATWLTSGLLVTLLLAWRHLDELKTPPALRLPPVLRRLSQITESPKE